MSQKSPKDIAASVHHRIINLARAQNSDANLLFTRYGLERFLYRLSRSPHADSFVLKGAMLFFVWTGTASRPTRDLDLLAHISPDSEEIRRVFQNICLTAVEDDALEFQANAMEIETTKGSAASEVFASPFPPSSATYGCKSKSISASGTP